MPGSCVKVDLKHPHVVKQWLLEEAQENQAWSWECKAEKLGADCERLFQKEKGLSLHCHWRWHKKPSKLQQ